MNDSTEKQLHQALRRCDSPEGFVSRVMAGLESKDKQDNHGRRIWYLLLAAVVALLFVFTGVDQNNKRQKQIRAEQTERQVVYALALTVERLNHINGRLQESAPQVRVENKVKQGR